MRSLFTIAALLIFVLPLYSIGDLTTSKAVISAPPPGPKTVIMADSLALVDLYVSTNGATDWTNRTNWLTGNVNTWHGIIVNSTTKRVSEVHLQSNHLTGTLPESIGNLTALLLLRVNSNAITGELPYNIGNLTQLLYLYVHTNQFTGEIPASIGNLKKVLIAYFYGNDFRSGLGWIGSNPVMQGLDFSNNLNLEGTIPNAIGNLTAMTYFSIFNTKISGQLPVSIGNCTALQKLYVHSSLLTGDLPTSIYNLVNLTDFYIHVTQLSGQVQAGMNNWTKMKILSIGNSNVSGTLPNLGSLTVMTDFYFQTSGIRGGPPASLANATNLAVLDMKFLELTSIPAFVANFTKLKTLIVNNNQLDAILNLTTHVNKANITYNVQNNKLDFGDLEPNFTGTGTTPYLSFTYSPQADIGTPESRYWNTGVSSDIVVTTPGTYNQYQWQKKDGSGVWQNVSGQIASTLTVASPVLGDAGEYRLKITNTRATALTLYTATFTVVVTGSTLPPEVANVEICAGSTTTLTATGTGDIYWYDAEVGGTEIETGPSFETPALEETTTYHVSQEISSIMSDRRPVVVTVKPVPTVTANADVSICAGASANVSVSGNAASWSWDNSLGSAAAYSVSPSTTTTYTVTGTGSNGCTATDQVVVTVAALPVANISPASPTICPGSAVTLNASGGVSYSWSDGYQGSSNRVRPSGDVTLTVTAYNSLGCSDTEDVTVDVDGVCPASPDNIRALPLTTTTGKVLWENNATNQTGFRIERKTGVGGSFSLVGTVGASSREFSDDNLSPDTEYYYRVKAYNGTGESPPSSNARARTFSEDQNYVEEISVLVDNVTNSAAVDNLPVGERIFKLSYLNGENDLLQEVKQEYSPGEKDVVQPVEYDALGRVAKQYLPYTIASLQPGEYRPDALPTEQMDFYDGTSTPDNVPQEDENPFSEVKFESTPLGRVIESSQPGGAWKMSTSNTNKIAYGANSSSEVVRWTITGTPSLVATYYYEANELSEVTSTDPEGLKVVTYADKFGNVVLTKRSADASSTTWLCNYSVYDEEGRLAYVIPPKAYAAVGGGSLPYTVNETLINSLCFKYVYDEKGRTIELKDPGIDPVYMVYDKWGRLALTQDGKQRLDDKWSFNKYDELNRIILTGVVVNAGDVENIRDDYEGYSQRYEVRSDAMGNVHGYTNTAQPTSPDKVFYVSYYDDYSFIGTQITGSEYEYDDQALNGLPSDHSVRNAGRKTGRKILVVDNSETSYLNGVSYFNDNGSAIQIITDNHKNGVDRASNLYSFTGVLTKSQLEHFQGDLEKERIVTKEFEYDHAGRLRMSWHQLDGGNKVLLSEMIYNEIGLLVREEFNKVENEAIQAIDYEFTVQGWLTGVNTTGDEVGDTDDYFTQELAFNDNFGSGNTERLDGFITANRWKNDISDNNHAYNYTYDAAGRLTSAGYKKDAGAGWTANVDAYTENGITYDENGNIQTLQRQTKAPGNNIIDELSYTYSSNSNKLIRVTDDNSNTLDEKGFVDGNPLSDDYTYDVVGNLTSDLNKGISSITYNSINLPKTVTLTNATITYVYDAFGIKLSQTYDGPGDPVVFDYIGDFLYVDDELQAVNTANGRILPSDCKNLIVNRDANSLSGFEVSPNGTAVDVEMYNGVSDNYVKATATTATTDIGIFPIGGTFTVKEGENYLFKVQGYQAIGTTAELYVWSNDGDIIDGGTPLPIGSVNEAIVSASFEIPEGVNSIKVGIRWNSPSVNDAFYINRVALYQTDWEYQYFLQDNQGNTRVVLQTTPGQNTPISTMETENLSYESFDLVDPLALEVIPAANHTEGGNEALMMDDGYRLAATKSLQVFPGDEIDVSVYAYYENSSGHTQGSNTIIAALVASALSGGATPVPGEAITGAYESEDELLFGLAPDVDTGKPAAFLNYILFNEDYLPIEGKSVPVGDDTFTLTQIALPTITVKEVGFVYVYLSYEDESALGVFFDDLLIKHRESAVVQVNAYYPFGLVAYGWIREGEYENRFLWQGKEVDENVGWYDFHARQYDPAVGRFWSLDPRNQFASGYVGMGNNPVMGVDPDGEWVHLLIGAVVGGIVNWATHGAQFNADGLKYFGIGAAVGALAAGTGFGVSSALAGNSFGAGVVGSSTALTAASGFTTGVAIGGSGGFVGGFGTGLGNSLVEGQSFNQALGNGLRDGLIGGVAGGLLGGLASGIDAARDGRYFWTGEKQQMLVEYKLNVPTVQQTGQYDCAFGCLEAVEKMNGGTRVQIDFANLAGNPQQGADIGDAITKAGFKSQSGRFGNPHSIGKQMLKGNPTIIAEPGGTVRHAVIPSKIQIWQRGAGTNTKTFFRTWVMNPATGNIGTRHSMSFWKNPFFTILLRP